MTTREWQHTADFTDDLPMGDGDGQFREADGFKIDHTYYKGKWCARIEDVGSHDECSCPRFKYDDFAALQPGDQAWQSGRWLIPSPMQVKDGARLMSLNAYPEEPNWYLALESIEPGTMQVGYAPYGEPHTALMPRQAIPVNRWFKVEVHYTLSDQDGRALTKCFVDRKLVGRSNASNLYRPTPLRIAQYARPYANPVRGSVVYFTDPKLGYRRG